jgi:RNase P/RNase MRP subunit p29
MFEPSYRTKETVELMKNRSKKQKLNKNLATFTFEHLYSFQLKYCTDSAGISVSGGLCAEQAAEFTFVKQA